MVLLTQQPFTQHEFLNTFCSPGIALLFVTVLMDCKIQREKHTVIDRQVRTRGALMSAVALGDRDVLVQVYQL